VLNGINEYLSSAGSSGIRQKPFLEHRGGIQGNERPALTCLRASFHVCNWNVARQFQERAGMYPPPFGFQSRLLRAVHWRFSRATAAILDNWNMSKATKTRWRHYRLCLVSTVDSLVLFGNAWEGFDVPVDGKWEWLVRTQFVCSWWDFTFLSQCRGYSSLLLFRRVLRSKPPPYIARRFSSKRAIYMQIRPTPLKAICSAPTTNRLSHLPYNRSGGLYTLAQQTSQRALESTSPCLAPTRKKMRP